MYLGFLKMIADFLGLVFLILNMFGLKLNNNSIIEEIFTPT
jgi:hypothetical protein